MGARCDSPLEKNTLVLLTETLGRPAHTHTRAHTAAAAHLYTRSALASPQTPAAAAEQLAVSTAGALVRSGSLMKAPVSNQPAHAQNSPFTCSTFVPLQGAARAVRHHERRA